MRRWEHTEMEYPQYLQWRYVFGTLVIAGGIGMVLGGTAGWLLSLLDAPLWAVVGVAFVIGLVVQQCVWAVRREGASE